MSTLVSGFQYLNIILFGLGTNEKFNSLSTNSNSHFTFLLMSFAIDQILIQLNEVKSRTFLTSKTIS